MKNKTLKNMSTRSIFVLLLIMMCIMFTGCGNTDNEDSSGSGAMKNNPPQIEGLTYESSMEPEYAEGFEVYYYNDGYAVIDVFSSQQYLIIPEGMEVPDEVPEDMIVIQKPVDNIYLAASSCMALFDSLDALDSIRFSGTDADGWYIENAAAAMKDGRILFAGKYSQPDYEGLVDGGCGLAIESTMLMHSPEVMEKISELGIPVFIDYSSYESHPLGRTEWIKLYAVLVDKQEEAVNFFAQQEQIVDGLADFKNTEKTVAFFYINSTGHVVVRSSDDYIPKMIEIAGGRYVFSDLTNNDNDMASMKISMEQFYDMAVEADYLIYNATIENPLRSIDELKGKSDLFDEFKAVKNGNVWTTDKYMYQATDITGELINDINIMLTDGDSDKMTFLMKVE